MKERPAISNAVIRRLPRYRRYLKELSNKGICKISSRELSELTGYSASQIRQDFNHFGGFGQQGYGYNVDVLYNEISSILGLGKEYKLVMVGSGNLGQAIVNHNAYYKRGFVVDAIFEIDPKLIGATVNGIEVRDYKHMGEYIAGHGADIGVICTTKDAAQEVADILCAADIKGIWNFAPVDLEVPEDVCVENVHLSDSLHALAYYMNNKSL